jgi:hypothetical protein
MNNRFPLIASAAVVACGAGLASAIIVPYTETFDSAASNWSKSSTFSPLTYSATGGPDGSAFGSMTTAFASNNPGDIPILFRGQSNFGSSGNAFVGNWITSGVTAFSFSVRHNGASPFTFFARFAPSAGPGVVALESSIPANEWHTFVVPISPSTPFIYEGTNFNIFASIARVQVGVMLDENQAGNQANVAFDIDNVSIIPAPAGGAVLAGAGLLAMRRRRR